MTESSGTTSERHWDHARIALGRVAELMKDYPDLGGDQFRQRVDGYEAIPEPVRQALEGMKPEERQAVTKLFATLTQHHFYLEDGRGGLEWL